MNNDFNDELMYPNLYYNYSFKNYKRVLKEVDDNQDNIENDLQKIFNDKNKILIEPYQLFINYKKDKKEKLERRRGIFVIYYYINDFFGNITYYSVMNSLLNIFLWSSFSIMLYHNSSRIDNMFEIVKNKFYTFFKYLKVLK